MEYYFTLKDNNQKAYYLFTWFLFFLHVAAAAFISANSEDTLRLRMYILLGFYVVIGLLFYIYRKQSSTNGIFSLLLAVFYAHFWLKYVGLIALLIFAAVFILVTLIKGKNTTVQFSGDGIHLTRVFKTIIFPWSAMDNVILKDNILTIDFKTNKIIQVEVAEQNRMTDEHAFNQFCKEQMQTPAAGV